MYRLSYFLPGLAVLLVLGLHTTQPESLRFEGRVAPSAEEICPLLVGAHIPDLQLTTVEGEQFDLNAAITNKPTLLIFYRGGWCPFCNMHLAELQNIEEELLQLGYQIIAVSMDRPAKLRESLHKHQLAYTLLSDSAAVAARAFGLAFQVTGKNTDNLEEASGQDHHILPVPAAYIIGTDGVIKFEYINPNYKVRIDSDILLAAARAEMRKE